MNFIKTWCYIITASGLHNIIVLAIEIYITIKLIQIINKKKHLFHKLILITLLMGNSLFSAYSFLSLRGCVRLFVACSGHPIVAYTLSDENISFKESDHSYNVYVRTNIKDEYGIPYLGPYWIKISIIGVLYFAYIQGV